MNPDYEFNLFDLIASIYDEVEFIEETEKLSPFELAGLTLNEFIEEAEVKEQFPIDDDDKFISTAQCLQIDLVYGTDLFEDLFNYLNDEEE